MCYVSFCLYKTTDPFSELCPHPATHKSSQHDSTCVIPNPATLNKEQTRQHTHLQRQEEEQVIVIS